MASVPVPWYSSGVALRLILVRYPDLFRQIVVSQSEGSILRIL